MWPLSRVKLSLILVLGSHGLFSQTTPIDPNNLTDEQYREAKNFTHTKKQQRLISEGCIRGANADLSEDEIKKLTEIVGSNDMTRQQRKALSRGNQLCGGNMAADAYGVSEDTVRMASQMWTTVIGMEGQMSEQKDHCRYIPIGTEVVAKFQQRTVQAHITDNIHPQTDPQYGAIMGVARSYDARKTNSKILAVGWGTTAGCYTIMAVKNFMNPDISGKWKNYLKLGAATFMTFYYRKMMQIHGNRANMLKKLAKSLPTAGDCNPITDRNCFCMEETTKNDPEHCLPFGPTGKAFRNQGTMVRKQACIDDLANEDPQCACIAQDTCLDKGYDVHFKVQGNALPPNFGHSLYNDLRGLSRGNIDTGELSGLERAKKRASRALGLLKDKVEEVPNDRPLSLEEKKGMEALKKMGVPTLTARGLALHRPSAGAIKSAQKYRSLKRRNPSRRPKTANSSGKIVRYEGGRGLRPKRNTKKNSGNNLNPYAHLLKKKGKPSSDRHNNKTLSFAREAQKEAQIHRRPETSLFTIISHRYRTTVSTRIGDHLFSAK